MPLLNAVVVMCIVTSCVTPKTATSGEVSESGKFTSEAKLKELMRQPKPEKVLGGKRLDVEAWELVGTLPERYEDAPHGTASLFASIFLASAEVAKAKPVESHECLARQVGQFMLRHKAQPGSQVRAYISARCGVWVPSVSNSWVESEAPAAMSDDELRKHLEPNVSRLFSKMRAGTRVGMSFERSAERAVVSLVWSQTETVLEPLAVRPGGEGLVVLRGMLDQNSAQVSAAVNQGPTAAAQCENVGTPPAFELVCPTLKTDAHTWISVMSRQPSRLLGYEVARLLVFPSGTPGSAYKRSTLVPTVAGSSAEEYVGQLNHVRGTLGLRPVQLSSAQSADNSELAPFYFSSGRLQTADQGGLEDLIALGVLAGWKVEFDIASGDFSAAVVDDELVSTLLRDQLEYPSTRRRLLDERAGLIGVGLYREQGRLAGLVSIYEPLVLPDFPDATKAVLAQLDAKRAKLKKSPVAWKRLQPDQEETFTAAKNPKRTFSAFLQACSSNFERAVSGWSISTSDLENIQWPDELLSQEPAEVAAIVTTHRDPAEPWGTYVVMVTMLAPAMQASLMR